MRRGLKWVSVRKGRCVRVCKCVWYGVVCGVARKCARSSVRVRVCVCVCVWVRVFFPSPPSFSPSFPPSFPPFFPPFFPPQHLTFVLGPGVPFSQRPIDAHLKGGFDALGVGGDDALRPDTHRDVVEKRLHVHTAVYTGGIPTLYTGGMPTLR